MGAPEAQGLQILLGLCAEAEGRLALTSMALTALTEAMEAAEAWGLQTPPWV